MAICLQNVLHLSSRACTRRAYVLDDLPPVLDEACVTRDWIHRHVKHKGELSELRQQLMTTHVYARTRCYCVLADANVRVSVHGFFFSSCSVNSICVVLLLTELIGFWNWLILNTDRLSENSMTVHNVATLR